VSEKCVHNLGAQLRTDKRLV